MSRKVLIDRSRKSNERGGALLLIAICLVVAIGIIGLAIDINIGLGARTDQQQVANSLATSAIEAYLADSALTQPARIAAAQQRATEIARLPKNQTVFKAFLANPSEQVNLCLKTNSNAVCSDTDQGAIVPGYWYVDVNTPGDPCRGASNYPCFIPGDGSAGDLTGFQVELKESNSSPIKTMFLKLFGVKNLQTRAVSTAAVVPRQIVASVDVSPSIVGTTHKMSGNIPPSDKRAFAYKLDGLKGFTCNSNHTVSSNPCSNPTADSPCPGIVHSTIERYDIMWNSTPVGPNPDTNITQHYKSDYQCWHVNDDGNGQADYLIDTHQNLNPAPGTVFYQGPEPLTTILNSISQALNVIKLRRNAGDRVQLSFFDTRVFPFREVPYLPDDSSQPFSLARIADDDSNYQEIQQMIRVNQDPADMAKRITEHALFPRINPLKTAAIRANYNVDPPIYQQDQDGGVFTNIALAVKRSADSLIRAGNIYARRNVVMFSDFIPNCTSDTPDSWCSNDWKTAGDMIFNVWWRGISVIYPPNKIAFNPILLGDYVRPHTMLPLNGEGTGCMWDQNAIRMTVPGPITDGNASPWSYTNNYGWGCPGPNCDDFNADPPNSYYYRPNYFYGPALDTGGEWGVIRPCCRRNGVCADVRPVLDQGCVSLDRELQDNTYESGWGCKRNEAGNHCKAGFTWKRNWIDDPATGQAISYLDDQGRVICDPQGRTEAQQMVDYMTKIMGSNSIILVQPK